MRPLLSELLPLLPYLGVVMLLALGGLALHTQGQLDNFVRATVSAVYRVAIAAAAELSDTGLAWLRSEDGINFRKGLVQQAYDYIPARIGPVPVGLIKMLISRDQFAALVERAFEEMVELAEELQVPPDIDATLLEMLPEK